MRVHARRIRGLLAEVCWSLEGCFVARTSQQAIQYSDSASSLSGETIPGPKPSDVRRRADELW